MPHLPRRLARVAAQFGCPIFGAFFAPKVGIARIARPLPPITKPHPSLMRIFGLVFLAASTLAAAAAPGVLGDWRSTTGSIVRIYPCGSDVCLRVVKLSPDAPTSTDQQNPDSLQPHHRHRLPPIRPNPPHRRPSLRPQIRPHLSRHNRSRRRHSKAPRLHKHLSLRPHRNLATRSHHPTLPIAHLYSNCHPELREGSASRFCRCLFLVVILEPKAKDHRILFAAAKHFRKIWI